MVPTDYQWLKARLEGIESRVTAPAPMNFPGAECVRVSTTEYGDNIQTFALDPTTRSSINPLPLVVLIGANYTQKQESIHRKLSSPSSVEEEATSNCRRNLIDSLQHYQSNSVCWASSDAKMASSSDVDLPDLRAQGAFHFVLTNFCLWITTERWLHSSLHGKRENLLKHNPFFDGNPNPSDDFKHLHALADILAGRSVLWIGHGVNTKSIVEQHFNEWTRQRRLSDWFFLPNLSDRRNCGCNIEKLARIKAFRRKYT